MNHAPIIVIVLLVAVVIYLFYSKSQTAKVAEQQISAVQQNTCVPFTKAQQDAQKRDLQAKCANKLIVPFVGPAQYAACMKNIDVQLTPINNC